MATSFDRPSGENGIATQPSQIATTSAVTLEQTPSHSIKEEDEDAKLFASLVNGIQTGAVSAAMTAMPISATTDPAENTDTNTAWSNAMSTLQGVTAGSFPSLDLVQSMSNRALGISNSLPMGLDNNPADLSQMNPDNIEDDIPPEPISAYAKLEFPGFSYYIQTLDFTIGRRPAEFRSQSSHQQHITDTGKSLGDVDVDLGPVKSISRFHVRIFHQESAAPPSWSGYSYGSQVGFVLQVLGRNGCFVDDVPIGKGSIVPLGKRTKIQIAERVFYFVLPPTHSLHIAMDEDGEEGSIGSSAEESEDGIEEEESSSGSLGGSSDEEESEMGLAVSSTSSKKKSAQKKKSTTDVHSGQGKGGKSIDLVKEEDGENDSKTSLIRKRKRGEPIEEETGVLKVGTPIGVEALNLNKRKKKVDSIDMSESSPPKSGKGKGAGKAAIVSAAMARARADVEAIQAAAEANLPLTGVTSDTVPSTPIASMDTSSADATPFSSASKLSASDKAKKPLPPAGPGVKPDKSNMDLIREAMNGPLSVSRGGKMALQEIYEYLTSTYEWFRNNSRANGRDWHSAIRHAVGNARDMDRIPRKAHEPGKGVFYAFANSDAARAARAEAAEASAVQSDTTNAATPTPPPSAISASNAVTPSGPSTSISTPMKASTTGVKDIPTTKSSTSKPANGSLPQDAIKSEKPAISSESKKSEEMASTSASADRSSSEGTTKADSVPPTTPASAIAADGRVRIVVGKAPDDALAQMAAAPKAAITQSIEALFGGPPIVHHEGTLFLSPIVFGSMSAQEISDIGGKGAQQALATLQAKLVAHLQSKMTAGAASPPPPSSPALGTSQQSPGPTASPLPGSAGQARSPMNNKPAVNQNTANATSTTIRPALAGPGSTTTARPPIQPRPQIPRPFGNGMTNPVRPGTVLPTSSVGRPTNMTPTASSATAARPMGRPPLTTIGRPTGQSGPLARPTVPGSILSRPGRPPLQPRPAVQGPSASIARPTTTVPTSTPGVRPNPITNTVVSGITSSTVRPSTTNARPAAGSTVGRPPLVRPGTPANTTAGSLARPAVGVTGITSRPPLHNAQRPLGTVSTAVATGNINVRPGIVRPGAGRPPLSARPRPPLPGQQVGRPPSTAAVAASQAGTAKPSLPTAGNTIGSSAPASLAVRPLSSTSARPAPRPASTPANSSSAASGNGVNGSNPTTNAPSASTTATNSPSNQSTSQSDMAALLALLTGGKLDSSKLTPAQHELLQRAGRLAAEQQKAQQQKVAAAVTAGGSTSIRSPSPVKAGATTSSTPVRPALIPKTPAATTTKSIVGQTSTAAPVTTTVKSGEGNNSVDTPSKGSTQK